VNSPNLETADAVAGHALRVGAEGGWRPVAVCLLDGPTGEGDPGDHVCVARPFEGIKAAGLTWEA
jgi:hypothetical protein